MHFWTSPICWLKISSIFSSVSRSNSNARSVHLTCLCDEIESPDVLKISNFSSVSRSDARSVHLSNISLLSAGLYQCEVITLITMILITTITMIRITLTIMITMLNMILMVKSTLKCHFN